MKKLASLITVIMSCSIFAADYKVDCSHFAGTKMVDRMIISYNYEKNPANTNVWSKEVNIVAYSPENSEIKTGTHQAHFSNTNAKNPDPHYDEVYFEPCLNCDYDAARINYMYDDNLGLLATINDISDGPQFAQFLKCKEIE